MTDLEKWMQGPCEVRGNGYIYPCEVLRKVALGSQNYLVRILLPDNVDHVMVVDKNSLMSRAHYNPTFDSAKTEKARKDEFLFPIGSNVKTKMGDRKIYGKVTKYNPATGEYTVLVDTKMPYAIQRTEKKLKLCKPGEVKPLPKFKYGDQVSVFNIGSQFNTEIGRVISSTYAHDGWRYELRGTRVSGVGHFMEEHLVPVRASKRDEPATNWSPKFKIGEKVYYKTKVGPIEGKVVAWSYIGQPEGHVYALQISKDEMKYRVNNVYESVLEKCETKPEVHVVVPHREKVEEVKAPVSEKVTVTDVPAFEVGEKVLICTARAQGKEAWMPGTIVREDTGNPYIPMSGSRWYITFSNRIGAFEWSYPANRIKKIDVEAEVKAEEVKPAETPVEEKVEEPVSNDKFKAGDDVVIIKGMFAGERGRIVKKFEEVITLSSTFWIIEMQGYNSHRTVREDNLMFYIERPADPEPEKTEEKTEEEIIADKLGEVFSGFYKMAEHAIENGIGGRFDFKKFVETIGPIKEYLGKDK